MSVDASDASAAALERARALIELRRYSDAVAILATLGASNPDDPNIWCLLAAAQLGDDQPAEALTLSEHASGLAPDADWPHRLRSRALLNLGRYADAAQAARTAVLLAPDEPAGYIQLAQTLTHVRGRLAEARVAARQALMLTPDQPAAHFVVGVVEAASGNRDEAEAAFRRTLEIDPNHTAAMNELTRLTVNRPLQRRAPTGLADAASGFATAVRTDPRAQTSRYNLELILRRFIALTAYLIFAAALFAADLAPSSAGSLRHAAPALLVVPMFFAGRFLARMPGELRRHLFAMLGNGSMRVAAAIEALAVAALIAGSLTPGHEGDVLLAIAVCSALAARLALLASNIRFTGSRKSPRRSRVWSVRRVLSIVVLCVIMVGLVGQVVSKITGQDGTDNGKGLPDCAAAGISTAAAREGSCVRTTGIFGTTTIYTVVDRAHALTMPGYNARLIAERTSETKVRGPNANSSDYPGGLGLIASFKLSITDTTGKPLSFDATGSDVDLLLTAPSSSEYSVNEALNQQALMSPTLSEHEPIRPHATVSGWVTFVAPLWASKTLNTSKNDLELFLPGQSHAKHVGQIRLWH